jgi:ketosteroid isomerase-like protein
MEAREIVREALRSLDAPGGAGFIERLADDVEMVTPLATLNGPDEVRAYVQWMHATFTEWHHDVTVESAGDLVVAEGTWNGTHTGPMPTPRGELAPTGKRISLPFAGVLRVRDERIVSVHNYFDQIAFMAQVGLTPEPAAA